jgi:hypothetical protein
LVPDNRDHHRVGHVASGAPRSVVSVRPLCRQVPSFFTNTIDRSCKRTHEGCGATLAR